MDLYYTDGSEFLTKEGFQKYSGLYIVENGEYFGRWTYTDRLPIVKISDLPTNSAVTTVKITKYLPVPSESDYEVGMITRYFVAHKLNIPSEVFEVDSATFDLIETATEMPYLLYQGVKIDWLIDDFGGKVDVAAINAKSTRDAALNVNGIRGLYRYFLNYKEFSKI